MGELDDDWEHLQEESQWVQRLWGRWQEAKDPAVVEWNWSLEAK